MGRPRSFDDDAVIDRAMEVFWTYGYANTSPAQLAQATGVAKGSLYNAFNSKRELFDRALARYDQQVSKLAHDLLARPGTTRECLRSALRFIVDFDLAQRSPRAAWWATLRWSWPDMTRRSLGRSAPCRIAR